ncbi:MAG: FimV/HubP family polar landmark protein, partial [Pseudomonadales bacterium]
MRRYEFLLLASIALLPVRAVALGLGDIDVDSALNQELLAEIELVAARDDIDTLEVGMASPDMFSRYGLDRPLILTQLRFEVVRRDDGAVVRVTTRDPVREPFITFLLEANWAGGRLIREYTILLDPPVFTSAAGGLDDSGFVEAPSNAFDNGFLSRTQDTAEPEDVFPEDVPVEATFDPDEIDVSADDDFLVESADDDFLVESAVDDFLVEDTQPEVQAAQPSFQPQYSGDTYGPIQRNETLWGIATRLRPDNSITINQMMIAIFRANPEAFEGNINRLKAGYVLRIPDATEIRTVGRGEALADAIRQHGEWDEWKSGLASFAPSATLDAFEEPEPSLSLVAPGGDESTDSFGTLEDEGFDSGQDFGAAVSDLETVTEADEEFFQDDFATEGIETTADDNLIDVEDTALADFQDDIAAGTFDEGTGVEEDFTPPPLDAVPDIGEEVFVDETVIEGPLEEVAEEAPAPVVTRPEPEPGLVDILMDNIIYVGAALLALLLVIGGVFFMRARKKRASAATSGLLSESWIDEGDEDVTVVAGAGDEEVTVVGGGRAASDEEVTQMMHPTGETLAVDEDATAIMGAQTMVDESAGESQDMSATAVAASGGALEAGTDEDTMIGKTVTMDESDPLSEADFNMAYGLYDEAAAIVAKAAEAEPSRKDLKVKLAEIHFAAGNNDAFVEVAQQLHELVGGAADADWDNVAIMGKQIAADNPLFAGGAPAAGGAVDLDFEAADSDAASVATDTGVDMDFGSELAEEPAAEEAAPAAEEPSDSIDFDISIAGGETESAAVEEPA